MDRWIDIQGRKRGKNLRAGEEKGSKIKENGLERRRNDMKKTQALLSLLL